MKEYIKLGIVTILGVVLGCVIGFAGTVYSSNVKSKEMKNQYTYKLENRILDKKEEISTEIIQSIYNLQKVKDSLIELNLPLYKEESYTILEKARIYCDQNVVDLYYQFLTTFFEEQTYDDNLVELELIPAIKKDLNVDESY